MCPMIFDFSLVLNSLQGASLRAVECGATSYVINHAPIGLQSWCEPPPCPAEPHQVNAMPLPRYCIGAQPLIRHLDTQCPLVAGVSPGGHPAWPAAMHSRQCNTGRQTDSLSFLQDYALAVAEFEMADAKAQREAAEAATLRRKAEQLEGQAIELAEKWTGPQSLNWLCSPLLWGLHLQVSVCQLGLPLQSTHILQNHFASGRTAAAHSLTGQLKRKGESNNQLRQSMTCAYPLLCTCCAVHCLRFLHFATLRGC